MFSGGKCRPLRKLQPETVETLAKFKITHNYLILLFYYLFLVHTVILSDPSVDSLFCLSGSIQIGFCGCYAMISSKVINNLEIKIYIKNKC